MSSHSLLSPSGFKDTVLCPGRPKLCSLAPPRRMGKAAIEGTAIHEMSELHLLGKKHLAEWEIGDIVTVEEEEFGLTHRVFVNQGMLDTAATYIEFCEQQIRELDATEYAVEEQVSLAAFGLPEVYGTADLIVRVPFGVLLVADLKTGERESVDADGNAQAMIYAAGAAGENLDTYEEIWIAIVQPRDQNTSKPAIRMTKITTEELAAWIETVVKPTVRLAMSDDPPLIPGDKQCKYCDAMMGNICPALTATSLAPVADPKAVDQFFQQPARPLQLQPPDPMALSDDRIEHLLEAVNVVEIWINAVREEAMRRAEAGKLPNWKVVAGRGRRSWSDEAEVARRLSADEAIFDKCFTTNLLSVPQLEKALKGEDEILESVKDLIVWSEGKPTLVPATDKRPALNKPTAEDTFADLLED